MRQSYEYRPDNGGMEALAAHPVTETELAHKIAAAVAVLHGAVAQFGRVVYANSLGAEAMVLTDLIWTQVPQIDMVTVDTGRLHPESLELLARLEARYQRRMRVLYPDARALERLVGEHGINGIYQSLENRLRCCEVRKVEPFRRAIAGYAAWVTGLRKDQSALRAATRVMAPDPQYGLYKVSPLLDWTTADIWAYIRSRDVPYNPLHDQGYASIGCYPCTRALKPDESERAGRWWWESAETRECGLHPRQLPTSISDL
jgi:phosphoadenosine phosphosulfate reductase